MKNFWEEVIHPMLVAAKSKHIVEIGSLDGLNTVNLISYIQSVSGHITVIDPAPLFDESMLQETSMGRLTVKRTTSLEGLPTIEDYDTVLIDGDHNWYTVFNELKLIEDAAISKGSLPLIFLHDTAWPYGRRDMYYIPETIPEKYRHPFAKKGIIRGQSALSEDGGVNADLNNATHENGSRNGVLIAIEDFLIQTKLPYFFHNLSWNHGLGIIVPYDTELNNAIVNIINAPKMNNEEF